MRNLADYVLDRDIVIDILDGPNATTEVCSDGSLWEHYAYELLLTNRALGTSMTLPWMQGVGITEDPDERPHVVVDCMISDAWSIETSNGFEDWAREWGYDTDSRRAEKMYREVEARAAEFIDFIGGAAELKNLALNYERV